MSWDFPSSLYTKLFYIVIWTLWILHYETLCLVSVIRRILMYVCLFEQTVDLARFRPQVLTCLLWAVILFIRFSKPWHCYLDLSPACASRWPVWNLGTARTNWLSGPYLNSPNLWYIAYSQIRACVAWSWAQGFVHHFIPFSPRSPWHSLVPQGLLLWSSSQRARVLVCPLCHDCVCMQGQVIEDRGEKN